MDLLVLAVTAEIKNDERNRTPPAEDQIADRPVCRRSDFAFRSIPLGRLSFLSIRRHTARTLSNLFLNVAFPKMLEEAPFKDLTARVLAACGLAVITLIISRIIRQQKP